MTQPSRLPQLLSRVAGQSSPKVIVAYHGSPHSFDRFDASKIGTGEGAQAYGHGLYFAQSPHVAEQYREELSAGLARHTPAEKVQLLWRYHDTPGSGDVKSTVRDVLVMDQERLGIDNRAALEYLESLPSGFVPPPPAPPPRLGRVYEVELGVPEEALLDWDSQVGSQGDAVQESMRALLGYPAPDSTGQQVYRTVVAPGDRLGITRGVRDMLQIGIPGIRYLDGQSRSAGQGTRNYVMFPGTEDRIRILRKY